VTCSRGPPDGNAAPAGTGTKGERFYDWCFFTVTLPDEPPADGYEHTLMIRRSISDPTDVAYFLAHAPHATATNVMVAVAGIRWRIEECNEQGKDLIGLDQHQVRPKPPTAALVEACRGERCVASRTRKGARCR
jgi:SRSO17 transposase